MKLLYEKGIPLLVAIMLAIQEMKWGEITLSYVAILFVCTYTMLCVLVIERKQWNVLIGLLVVAVSIVGVLYVQGWLTATVFNWVYLMFVIQTILFAIVTRYIYVKSILFSGFLIAFVVLRLGRVIVSPVLVCLILFCFLVAISELIHVSYYKRTLESRRTMGLIPVFVLFVVIMFLIPVKNEPFSWSFVTDPVVTIYENVRTIVENVKDSWNDDGNYFSYQLYQDESDGESVLGGTIKDKKRILLKVKGRRSDEHTIYLTGSVYDTYTGTGWVKDNINNIDSEGNNQPEYQLARDEMEMACEANGWDQVEEEFVLREQQLDIQYGRQRTKTIFYPEYLNAFSGIARKGKLQKDTANISFDKVRKRGYEYKAYYKDVNLNSQYVKTYLRSLDQFNHENVALERRAVQIKEDYRALPGDLPGTVRDKAIEVTERSTNSYDKMISICTFLRQFQYSKKVEDVAKGKDFVEDFLYRTQSGYCTYFATTAAVMGRCIGIPTRYVEGMIVPKECKRSKGYYLVDGECMHAWCEAYFEGFGWVRFEATPGFADKEGVWERTTGENYYEKTPVIVSDKPQVTEDVKLQTETKKESDYMRWIVFWGIFIVGVIAVFMGICFWNRRKERTRNEQCTWIFRRILLYLRKLGLCMQKGETLIEFQNRVNIVMENKELWKQKQFEEAVKLFLRMRFGEIEPETSELKKSEELIRMLRLICKSELGSIRYYVILLEEKMLR